MPDTTALLREVRWILYGAGCLVVVFIALIVFGFLYNVL